MQRCLFWLLCCWFVTLSIIANAAIPPDPYRLEQVVIFSRHGLRDPLTNPDSSLGKMTPYQWPQLATYPGYLTLRGGILEDYFAHYLRGWFAKYQLLPDDQCPKVQDVYIYANSFQRTIATAQYFSVGAFAGCDIPVIHKEKMGTMDPLFFPVIRDGSDAFLHKAAASVNHMLGHGGVKALDQRLVPIYANISALLNLPKSPLCLQDKQCELTDNPSKLILEKGEEPIAIGALNSANSIADALLLQYYEGTPLDKIGWGRIKNFDQLAQIVSIKEDYNQLLFRSPVVARHISSKLITAINQRFTGNAAQRSKVTYFVGHDSNIASILAALDVRPYQLPHQLEKTPIGGKVIFQKWVDPTTGKAFMKIEYFYQSIAQLHQFTPLSDTNPPQKQILELQGCPIDKQGFCDFSLFAQLLQRQLAG